MVLGKSGQAAIVDAMFLLTIVAGLSALMFFFITGSPVEGVDDFDYPSTRVSAYGVSVSRIASNYYGSDFTTSALQALLLSSTPRRETESLRETKEVDYLLAFLKEDYSNDREFASGTQKILAMDVNTIMRSTLSTHDSIFVMRRLPADNSFTGVTEFVFVLFKHTDFRASPPEWHYYLCAPGPGMERVFEEELLGSAGKVIRAQPVVLRFSYTGSGSGDETDKILTTLHMWPVLEFSAEVVNAIHDPAMLNCEKIG